jgi:queuine tRNA-ribosyltransferase
MNPYPRFTVGQRRGMARLGLIETAHGPVHTPAFYFCATQATLKGLAVPQITALDTQLLLANTYHLMLQPGSELIARLGGLQKFMGWPGPTFTDSGGYQIFSLHHGSVSDEIKGRRRFITGHRPVKITEEGALFTSHRDGSKHLLSPERSIQVQSQLGADMICVLDECTPLHMTQKATLASMHLSHRWAERSLQAFAQCGQAHQGLYGIVQGGVYPEFRKESGQFIADQPFFGHAIGGSLGADKAQMAEVIAMALQTKELREKPIHLLGIGDVGAIFFGVRQGIDTFDCVSPTRLGRHGGALVKPAFWQQGGPDDERLKSPPRQSINLRRQNFRDDPRPIDAQCPCTACRLYSRAYLHHLLKAGEILALTLLTEHNVAFMNRLMQAIRQAILDDTLDHTQQEWAI